MDVRRLDDPVAFLDTASPLLLEDEARHNLMLGIAATLRDEPEHYPERRLWLVEEASEVVGAALQTPPHHLVLARPREGVALEALVAAIDDDLPGVNGAVPEAELFAGAWTTKTGKTPRKTFAQGLFQLERVEPVSGVSGEMREAGPADRELLIDWWEAFHEEALHGAPFEPAAHAVDHRLSAADAGAVIWEDGGPVSFAAFGGPTPNGIRIGPVYTPPELRRRGYASALTAGLSSRLLETRRFCFLYTDLANPTSNKIYEQIGYRRVCEAASIAFD